MKVAIKVCITGAAGQIAYALFDHILSGKTFGPDQVILHLIYIPFIAFSSSRSYFPSSIFLP
jgi:hypothetical protein